MFRIFYLLIALGLIAALLLGFAGFIHPALDTFSHGRWLIALALLGLAIVGLFISARRAALILLIFAGLGVWQSDVNNRIQPQREVKLKYHPNGRYLLLHYNLKYNNPRRDEAIKMVLDQDADILSLTEISSLWEDALYRLEQRYPHKFHCPEWKEIGGSMIYSKYPIISDADYCHSYAALGLTRIKLPHGVTEIGTVHIRWPWPASGPGQIEALKPKLEALDGDVIIAGDFNATPWSHSVEKFAAYGELSISGGHGGTWMPHSWLTSLAPFFGLPIDLIMTKGNIKTKSTTVLPSIGSDHLPVLVEFNFDSQVVY